MWNTFIKRSYSAVLLLKSARNDFDCTKKTPETILRWLALGQVFIDPSILKIEIA